MVSNLLRIRSTHPPATAIKVEDTQIRASTRPSVPICFYKVRQCFNSKTIYFNIYVCQCEHCFQKSVQVNFSRSTDVNNGKHDENSDDDDYCGLRRQQLNDAGCCC